MSNANKAEKGQTLVLIILAIVGMMGFAALAVDFGRIYAERRRAQSAADASALAAAFAASQGNNWLTAGNNLSLENGFNNDGINNTVTINNPPASGPYKDNTQYFQVIIWEHVPPIFSQFVFGQQAAFTVEAVARARPTSSVSSGNAIHSLDPSVDSMNWNGDVDVKVDGGHIFSNGNIDKTGTSGIIKVTHGGIFSVGPFTRNGNPTITPTEVTGVQPQGIEGMPEPYCPNHNETGANGVKYYYHDGLSGSAVLQPGFHCFYDDIQLTGGDVVTGDGVVLIMMEGGISMTGTSSMNIKRPADIVDANGNHYGGLLIYAPPSNTSVFTLGGNTDSWFTGTILAPGGVCDIGGTPAGTGRHTALICWQVRNHGTSDVNIIYSEGENYRISPTVELAQ